MSARPFSPEMGKARRQVHGAWWALGGLAITLVVVALDALGWLTPLVSLAAVVALVVALGWLVWRGLRWAIADLRESWEQYR